MPVKLRPRYFFGGLMIAAVIAGAFTLFTGLSFWLTWPMLIVALLINVWLAEWEDNQPGGFNNP